MRLYFIENVSFGFTNLNTLKISFWCFSVNLFVLYVVALNVALKQDSMLSYLNRQLSPPCSESTSTTEFLVSHVMWFDWLILLVCNVVWNRKIKYIIKQKLFWTIDVLLMMNHRCTDYALVFDSSHSAIIILAAMFFFSSWAPFSQSIVTSHCQGPGIVQVWIHFILPLLKGFANTRIIFSVF